jgi:hypothetical protein
MTCIEEFDQRQLYMMAASIRAFEAGKLQLSGLISNLEGLLGWLNVEDPNWREPFRAALETIETIYAVALDRTEGKISCDDQAEITTALKEIDSCSKPTSRPVSTR